jgi:hypothetical protein
MFQKSGVLLTSAALFAFSQSAAALSFSANAHEDGYGVQASQSILPTVRAGAGYFTSDDSGHHADVYSGSLMFSPPLPLFDVEVGARYQYQDTYYGNGGGVGLGGSVFIPTPIPLLKLGGYGFYTPEGLTHGSLKESYDYGAEARLKLTSQTYAFGGYRYYRTQFDHQSARTLDSGTVVGVSVGF